MEKNNIFDVIVVGAGPGGATVAALLANAGKRVLVVDKNASAGGKMATVSVGGHTYERFPLNLIPYAPSLFERLAETVGKAHKIRNVAREVADKVNIIYKDRDGNILPLDINDFSTFKKAGITAFAALKTIGKLFFMSKRQIKKLEKISALDYMNSMKMPEALRVFLTASFGEGAFEMTADKVPASHMVRILKEALIRKPKDMRYYEGGVGGFFDTVCEVVAERGGKLLFNTRVKSIDVENKDVTGVTAEKEAIIDAITENKTSANVISEKEVMTNAITENKTSTNVISEKEVMTNAITENKTLKNVITKNKILTNVISENEKKSSAPIKNKAVIGVTAESGEKFYAPLVVSNAGIRQTVFKLVGEEKFPKEYAERIRGLQSNLADVGYRYFTNKPVLEYSTYVYYTYACLEHWSDFEAMARGEKKPENNYIYIGSKSVYPTVSPEGKQIIYAVMSAHPDPEKDFTPHLEYIEATTRVLFPKLFEEGVIERREIMGLREVYALGVDKIFDGQGGESYGVANSIGQSDGDRPSCELPIEGLYCVGNDTEGFGVGTHRAVDSGFKVFKKIAERTAR